MTTACNYLCVVEHNDALDEATRVLYATPPDDFLAKRSELAAAAKRAGDADTARAITTLRKPTVAAWIVNAFALANPELVGQLSEVGGQLRQAQDSLEVDKLRDLSSERRKLVGGLTEEALRHAGRLGASTTLRDEVTATFDAAVADPSVAASLGSLQHGEQFSGFGFAESPQLTLVRGGRAAAKPSAKPSGKPSAKPATAAPAEPKRSPAEERRLRRALQSARQVFEAAQAALAQAQEAEGSSRAQLAALENQLEEIRQQITDTREQIDSAKHAVAGAKANRRAARTALDRAERAVQQ